MQTFSMSLSNPDASWTFLLESVLKGFKVLCKKKHLWNIKMIYTQTSRRLSLRKSHFILHIYHWSIYNILYYRSVILTNKAPPFWDHITNSVIQKWHFYNNNYSKSQCSGSTLLAEPAKQKTYELNIPKCKQTQSF